VRIWQPPPEGEHGPLWWLGYWLKIVGGEFYALYDAIKDIWLIGDYLAWPFYLIHLWLDWAGGRAQEADDRFLEIWRDLWDLLTGVTFDDLLYALSWNFWHIVHRARDWIKDKLIEISWNFHGIIYYATDWVRGKLFEISGHFREITYYATSWVRSRLYEISGHFWWIVNRATDWVKARLYEISWHLRAVVEWPVSWVKDRILEGWPHLYNLFYDPRRFLWELFVAAFEWFWQEYDDWLLEKLENLISRMWTYSDEKSSVS